VAGCDNNNGGGGVARTRRRRNRGNEVRATWTNANVDRDQIFIESLRTVTSDLSNSWIKRFWMTALRKKSTKVNTFKGAFLICILCLVHLKQELLGTIRSYCKHLKFGDLGM
jgi:hypothetical protein